MRSPLTRRVLPVLVAVLLLVPNLMMAGGAQAQDQLILRVGTDQKLETLNPWQSITYADYEMFTLQYELLVSFDINLEPAPGFAEAEHRNRPRAHGVAPRWSLANARHRTPAARERYPRVEQNC